MKPAKSLSLFLVAATWITWSDPSVAEASSDHDEVRRRVVIELIRPEVDDTEVESLIATLKDDGTWPGIDYNDVSRTGFEHRVHSQNMVLLARAYKNKTSRFYRNEVAKTSLELALAKWVKNDYFCDNWWHNQIGTPDDLVSVMLIIGNELPHDLVEEAQPIIGRAHLDASGARPSGDRIKIAGILAKNLLFIDDAEQFEKVVKVIEGEIKFVAGLGGRYGYSFRENQGGLGVLETNGRGMQYDYSFHHRTDGVNNTLSYGLGYADASVEWAFYVAGTKYSFSDEKLKHLVDYFLDGICKTAAFGKYPDAGAKNRSFSRIGTLKAYGARTAERLLLTSDYRRNEIQEIVDIRNSGKRPTRSHATFYWQSEHFTFQRPSFFTSVRMYSTRIHNMEQPYNSEGLLNHHRGDGSNHISRTGDEYYDIAPVFDYQKIPGATIVQKPKLPSEKEIQKLGLTDFVGAVTDGLYGAVAFDFKSPHDPLCGRKSWFFFDQEYVCLGAGISSRMDLPVVTTVNQCLLRSNVTVSVGNKKSVLSRGERELDSIDWVYQDGIGYLFPKPSRVSIKNNEARGSWFLVNKQTDSPKKEIKKDVFTLWLDHGVKPDAGTYEYIVVPATSVAELDQNSAKEKIAILSNTTEIQAVRHTGLELFQAVFYRAGEVQLTDRIKLTCDSPGIVMLRIEGDNITEVSVSDPNRELSKIHLGLSAEIQRQGENFQAVWNEDKAMTEVVIGLPLGAYAGKSVTVDLRKPEF